MEISTADGHSSNPLPTTQGANNSANASGANGHPMAPVVTIPAVVMTLARDLPDTFQIATTWDQPGWGRVIQRNDDAIHVRIIGHYFALRGTDRVMILANGGAQ